MDAKTIPGNAPASSSNPAARRAHRRWELVRQARLEEFDIVSPTPATLDVRIIEVSLTGAQVESGKPLDIPTFWHLVAQGADERPFRWGVRACWCRTAQPGRWTVGLQLIWPPDLLLSLGVGFDEIARGDDAPLGALSAPAAPPAAALDAGAAFASGSALAPAALYASSDLTLEEHAGGSVHVEGRLTIARRLRGVTLGVCKGLDGESASLAGGVAWLGAPSRVATLGDFDHAPTRVVLGAAARRQLGARSLELCDRRIAALVADVAANQALGPSPRQRERATVLEYDLSTLRTQREELLTGLLAAAARTDGARPSISVDDVIHPGVILACAAAQATFSAPVEGPISIELLDEREFVVVDPQTLEARPLASVAGVTVESNPAAR